MVQTSQRDPYFNCCDKQSRALIDEEFRVRGFPTLAGVDEAGRGPLAGPVVAAAVILPPGVVLKGVNDSKMLSLNERLRAFELIVHKAMSVGIGVVGSDEIDRINILQASLLAMRKAVDRLAPLPDALLIDGPKGIRHHIPQFPLIKGDRKSQLIASASVVAKVVRDWIMSKYHEAFPEYGFVRNRGYGTPEHLRALQTYGCCPIHRKTFRGVSDPSDKRSKAPSLQTSLLR